MRPVVGVVRTGVCVAGGYEGIGPYVMVVGDGVCPAGDEGRVVCIRADGVADATERGNEALERNEQRSGADATADDSGAGHGAWEQGIVWGASLDGLDDGVGVVAIVFNEVYVKECVRRDKELAEDEGKLF